MTNCNHKFKVSQEKQWRGEHVWLYDIKCKYCDYDDFFVLKARINKEIAIEYSKSKHTQPSLEVFKVKPALIIGFPHDNG